MKREYDLSRAKRGPIAPAAEGKTRITIRIDDDILGWFRRQVHDQGGGNYQTLINLALREHITREDGVLAETLRRVLREEMATYAAPRTSRSTRTPRKRAGG
jgi:hypothetical protein